jgi:hypothetical protein
MTQTTVGALKRPIQINIKTIFDLSPGAEANLLILKGKTLLKKSKIPPVGFGRPIKTDKFIIQLSELDSEKWGVIAVKSLVENRWRVRTTRPFEWHFWIRRCEQAEFESLRWKNKVITVQRTMYDRAYLLAKLRKET